MRRCFITFVLLLCVKTILIGQEFKTLPDELINGPGKITFGNILVTTRGTTLIASSGGLVEQDGVNLHLSLAQTGMLTDSKGRRLYTGKNSWIFKDVYESFSGVKLLTEGPDDIVYVASGSNSLGLIVYNLGRALSHPPFNFQNRGNFKKVVTSIYVDGDGTLFIATNTDTIYTVENATKIFPLNSNDKNHFFNAGLDRDSNYVVLQGAKPVKHFRLGAGITANCFCQNVSEKRILLIGTNNGIFGYDKLTGQLASYFKMQGKLKLTVTHIEAEKNGLAIWFSTLERGIAKYNTVTGSLIFFKNPKKQNIGKDFYPVLTFSRKSDTEFFLAIGDSLPAVFNTQSGEYNFITDTIFSKTPNNTNDIKADAYGNLFVTKGGGLFWSKSFIQNKRSLFTIDTTLYGPYLTDISIDGTSYGNSRNYYGRYETLNEINLKYNENKLGLFYSCRGIDKDSLVFSWKMDNYSSEWTSMPYSVFSDDMNMLNFELQPGHYIFRLRAKNIHGAWLKKETQLSIIISPPFWQVWWFWGLVMVGITLITLSIVKWRVNAVRKQERIKARYEKQALELEAKALRSQMNPHFIFNCMNSIKSLIQQKEEDTAINYLTTFSKLLRTILYNCDKREITLYDEIETCRLYTQLESLRFGKKITYSFLIDEALDLKSVMVPALIIQPFIENAIWHGIMPKEASGKLTVQVVKHNDDIVCSIDDDGIGIEMSKQNKFKSASTHQSKGVHLTQARLDIDNLLNERNARVEIIDKKNEDGKSAGTTIILTFKED